MNRMTDAFRTAWSAISTRRPVAVATVELATRTLRFATSPVRIDGQQYEPILGPGTASNVGRFLGTAVTMPTADFVLADKDTSYGGTTASLFSADEWIGAVVTLALWERSLTSGADLYPFFYGRVQSYSIRTAQISVQCAADKGWNRTITPKRVTRANCPQAPDGALGATLGTYYGKVYGTPLRPPHADPYGATHRRREEFAGGTRLSKATLVDTGRGPGGSADNPPAKVLVAGHPLRAIGRSFPSYGGTSLFRKGKDGRAHPLEAWGDTFTGAESGFYVRDASPSVDAVSATLNNATLTRAGGWPATVVPGMRLVASTQIRPDSQVLSVSGTSLVMTRTARAGGSGLTIAFEATTAWAPAPAIRTDYGIDGRMQDLLGFPNATVDNPNALLDPSSEYSFCRLDSHGTGGASGGAGGVLVYFADVDEGGTAVDGEFVFTYRTSPTVASLYYTVWQRNTGTSDTVAYGPVALAASPTAPTTVRVSLVGDMGKTPSFDIGSRFYVEISIAEYPAWDGDVGLPPYQYGLVDWFFAGAAVRYVPEQANVVNGKRLVPVVVPRPSSNSGVDSTVLTTYADRMIDANVFEQDGDFLVNVEGWPDADGTYTGAAGALIERPPDVVRHMLAQYGGEAPGAFATDVGDVGSFVDARAALVTRDGNPMVLGFGFDTATSIGNVLAWIMQACAVDIFRTPGDGVWRMAPWGTGGAPTYTRPVSRYDLLDPTTGPSVVRDYAENVAAGASVQYGRDALDGGYKHTVLVTPDGSMAGFDYHGMRDGGPFDITANANDRIERINVVGASASVTIPSGTYDRASLIAAVAAVHGGGWSWAFAGEVVAGVNDMLAFKESSGGATVPAYILPGAYPSLAALAAAALAAIATAGGTGWTVAYSAGRFSFWRGGSQFSLVWSATAARSAAAHFGYPVRDVPIGTAPSTSPAPVYLDRCVAAIAAPHRLPWRSGAYGLLGTKTSAWEVLGFDWALDSGDEYYLDPQTGTLVAGYVHVGTTPRRALEALLGGAAAAAGNKPATAIEGRCIMDTATALECRDRNEVIGGTSRPLVSLPVATLPDLQRGDSYACDVDMDTLRDYGVPGLGGLWSERVLRVVETHQRFGDAWHTEIGAVDLTI